MTSVPSLAMVLVSVFTSLHATTPGTRLAVTKTCQHVYGTVLYTAQSVPSSIECARQCTQLSTCQSVLFQAASSTCMLNNSTADIGTLPGDCGVAYMDYQVPQPVTTTTSAPSTTIVAPTTTATTTTTLPTIAPTTTTASSTTTAPPTTTTSPTTVSPTTTVTPTTTAPPTVPPPDPCYVTADCNVNGTVCLNNVCQCAPGMVYDAQMGVCSSTLNRAVCNPAAYCFTAVRDGNPWAEDNDHLRQDIDCDVTFPNASIPAGGLRIAIIIDVIADIQPFNYGTVTYISPTESVFTTAFQRSSPGFQFPFQAVYYGHIVSPGVIDVPYPESQCRLLF